MLKVLPKVETNAHIVTVWICVFWDYFSFCIENSDGTHAIIDKINAKMRNAEMNWNARMKIRYTVSLNSKRVCVYCSWTQASKIHCTSTVDLIKTVIHFVQAPAIWSKQCTLFNALIKTVIHCTSTASWSKWCALFNSYFHILFSFLLFSQLL